MILLKIIQLQLKRKQNDKFDSNIWKDFVITDVKLQIYIGILKCEGYG